MIKRNTLLLALLALFCVGKTAHSQDVVDVTTLNNKIMAGYQGWFAAEGDGSGEGWIHWGGNPPSAEKITIDFWPDLREYEADELFNTNFVYQDGSNAGLYSAYTPKTVDRHVKWMKDYGIDGVFVQRFINSAVNLRNLRDQVLQNVRFASENHGRVFANMYDISGGNDNTMVEILKNDWMHLVDDLRITESPNYLHHNGLPVLSIWGLGSEGRPGTPEIADELIQWFTVDAPEKYRVTLKAGLNNKWQSHSAEWQTVYAKFDVISPWAVGRYKDNAGADNFRRDRIEPDLVRTQSLNIDYMPVVFPGFSWFNLKDDAELNSHPRNGGNFLWHQFFNAIDAGCNMVYVAMYDEVDEGTAIYKLAENVDQLPTTGTFIPLDYDGYELPGDWYLRLTGEASRMLRDEIPLTSAIPVDPTINDAIIISQDVPTIMSPGAIIPVSITVKNTGKTSWTTEDGFELGSQQLQDNTIWGMNRIKLDEGETIAPDDNKTFTFDVTAPANENAYNFRWRMVQEGVNWFGELSENRLINVGDNVMFLDDCDSLTDWNSSGSLILNSIDQQQGSACIEFTGGTADEYSKVFSTSYNSNISAYNAVLQFWYYVSDASKLEGQNRVEMGSAGKADEDVYFWTISGLATGWNLISLEVKNATSIGNPDLNAVNWFSFQNTKTESISTRIDEIQILDINANAVKYQLVVVNGTGSGNYVKNSAVNIIADAAPSGQKFDEWVVSSGDPILANKRSLNTSIILTAGDAEVLATYKQTGNYLDDCDDNFGWRDASYTSLNTTDHKQGMGCIEFTGIKSPEFAKSFQAPYNSGVTESNGALQLLYYVSDDSKMGTSNQIEIGSAGKNDQDEYNWKLTGVSTGWNFLSLRISDAGKMGNPDLSAINWFRLYDIKTGELTSRIDAIRIVNINTVSKYALTVDNGSGSGTYYENELVSITADNPPAGKVFDSWIVTSGGVNIEDVSALTTSVTMPGLDASVSATYKDEAVGIGNADYFNYAVTIYPNPAKTEVSIDITIEKTSEINVSLSDLSGRILGYSIDNLLLDPGHSAVKLPVSGVMPGAYLLKINIDANVCTKVLMIE